MKNILYGHKVGMSQLIEESGEVVPVTLIKLEDSKVISSAEDSDRYVLGFVAADEKKLNKPKQGFFKKHKSSAFKVLREVSIQNEGFVNEAGDIDREFLLEEGLKVNVRSKTKGRGFAGTIKRHGFHRGPMTHGSKNHRLPGSIGAGTDPARVFKGTRMSGRYGNKPVTMKNLKVVRFDHEKNVLCVKGGVPGCNGTLVEVFK